MDWRGQGKGMENCDTGLAPCHFEPHRLSVASVNVSQVKKTLQHNGDHRPPFQLALLATGKHIISQEFLQKGKRVVTEKLLIYKIDLVWISLPLNV